MAQPNAGDDLLVPLFRNHAMENKAKSAAEGRPIFEDVEVVDVRAPGTRNYGTYPANQMSNWINDPYTGEQRPVTYAERFQRQYRQFKEHQEQTKSGTPLELVGFLSAARQAELRAQNIYTVEALAAIEGSELKNLGPGGRELKNQAFEYIAKGRANVPNLQMQAELEAMRAKLAVMEEDRAAAKNQLENNPAEAKFEAMTPEQLREFIKINTGHAPIGILPKKNLIRLALEVPEAKTP